MYAEYNYLYTIHLSQKFSTVGAIQFNSCTCTMTKKQYYDNKCQYWPNTRYCKPQCVADIPPLGCVVARVPRASSRIINQLHLIYWLGRGTPYVCTRLELMLWATRADGRIVFTHFGAAGVCVWYWPYSRSLFIYVRDHVLPNYRAHVRDPTCSIWFIQNKSDSIG